MKNTPITARDAFIVCTSKNARRAEIADMRQYGCSIIAMVNDAADDFAYVMDFDPSNGTTCVWATNKTTNEQFIASGGIWEKA